MHWSVRDAVQRGVVATYVYIPFIYSTEEEPYASPLEPIM